MAQDTQNWNDFFTENKKMWNQRTAVHLDSAFYDKTGFINGNTVLNDIELKEVGDVNGKSLLHLQCHFGMDSLNWSRLGAKVTGIDFSETAIEAAKELNAQLGLDAEFICSDIYDLVNIAPSPQGKVGMGLFDIVFTSYGTIGWLPDLKKWAAIVAAHIKPGGIFYIADFHPVLWMLDDNFEQLHYHYFNHDVIVEENKPTYTENNEPILTKQYSWNHSISDILNALLEQGLQLEFFNEYNYSPYNCFPNTVEIEKGKWQIKGLEGKLPMVYSIKMLAP